MWGKRTLWIYVSDGIIYMNSGVRENSHVHIFSGRRKNSFILNCWTIKPYMSVLFWKWDRWTIYRHTSALCSILSFVCMCPAQHHLQFSHLDRHVSDVWTCLHSSYSHPESASAQPLVERFFANLAPSSPTVVGGQISSHSAVSKQLSSAECWCWLAWYGMRWYA